jgi:hypothetical protein
MRVWRNVYTSIIEQKADFLFYPLTLALPATSAVDVETDRAIQEIIRGPSFADVTMFIVA